MAGVTKRQKAAADEGVASSLWLQLYEEMLFYRRFEERVNMAYTQRKFSGFCHLHIGQEALCVGTQRALTKNDYMISSYRSHTQAIAKGIAPVAVFAELFARADGCSHGKGGSMHMFSKEHRFLGGHGIVGGQGPIAVGVSFAIQYRKEDAICVCYLGDAAMNQGQVFEAMNMAATWKLPVLFVIENNRYGMGTDIRRTTSVTSLRKRALAFDMANSDVDGMDVLKVLSHMRGLVSEMKATGQPHLVEALTYRYRGHSVSDPATYRTKEEVQKYQEIDPIKTLGEKIVAAGLTTAARLEELDEEIRERVKSAEAEAEASPQPPLEWAVADILAP